tara:strand:- start:4682 stop:5266 length:585 start_codon:yes stop_codon:yes gene_type:complete
MTKFVFCFFDLSCTPEFLKSWVNLCHYLNHKGIQYLVTQGSSCNAFYAKQMCLGGNVLAGPKQNPFQGRLKYEQLVFLSGSISFSVGDFINIINKSNNLGLSFISAKVKNRFKTANKFINNIAIVEHTEFDMTIIRRGVLEKLTYPWFKPHVSKSKKDTNFVDIDICKRIREEAMIDLYVYDDINIKRKTISYE